MVAIFSPFFCDTNVIETHSAARRWGRFDPWGISLDVPSPRSAKKRTCSIVSIFVFLTPSNLLVVEYSQERIAKNNAPVVRVVMALDRSSVLDVRKNFQNASGRQAWLFLGGSLSLYAFSWRLIRAPFVPSLSLVGSLRKFVRNS